MLPPFCSAQHIFVAPHSVAPSMVAGLQSSSIPLQSSCAPGWMVGFVSLQSPQPSRPDASGLAPHVVQTMNLSMSASRSSSPLSVRLPLQSSSIPLQISVVGPAKPVHTRCTLSGVACAP